MWTQPDADGAGGSNNNGSSVAPGNASPGDMITGDELAAGAVAVAGRDMPSVDATSGATTGTEDIEFIVQYGKVNNMTMYETVAKLENVSIYRGWTMVATLSAQNFSTAKLNSLLAPPSSPPVSWQAKLFFLSLGRLRTRNSNSNSDSHTQWGTSFALGTAGGRLITICLWAKMLTLYIFECQWN